MRCDWMLIQSQIKHFIIRVLYNPWMQRVMWLWLWFVSWQRHLNYISLPLSPSISFLIFFSIVFISTCNSLHTWKTSYITNRLNRQANRLKQFFHRRTFDKGYTKNISVSNKSVSRQNILSKPILSRDSLL